MAFYPSRRKLKAAPDDETGELNFVPYLDVLMNLIVFMLLSLTGLAAFGIVNVSAPAYADPAASSAVATPESAEKPNLLLSVLLFPSLVPVWIGAVKVTHSLWAEGTVEPVRDWIKVMAVSDVLGLALAAFLYEWIQEASE